MILNGVVALILRYFTEFGSFRGALVKVVEGVVIKKFTFAISSPNKFVVNLPVRCGAFIQARTRFGIR